MAEPTSNNIKKQVKTSKELGRDLGSLSMAIVLRMDVQFQMNT